VDADNFYRAGIPRSPILPIERRSLDCESFRYQNFAWWLPAAAKTGARIGARPRCSTRCACVTERQLKMSARDAARLLGLSHQRLLQLTQGEAERYEEAKRS
jgi:hypothetical protein